MVPVRTSVRVKLKRSGSGSKQPASSSALSGKQLPVAQGKHRHRHQSTEPDTDDLAAAKQDASDANEADVGGSRMQSSSRPDSALDSQHQMPSRLSAWEGANTNPNIEPADEVNSAVSSQAAAHAASGQSGSQEQQEGEQGGGASPAQAPSGSHAGHAVPSSSYGVGDALPAVQSHVTGAPHSQAQQGRFMPPTDTAHSIPDQPLYLTAFSMTESNAGVGGHLSTQAEHSRHAVMPSAHACQSGTLEHEAGEQHQYQGNGTPQAAAEGAELSSRHATPRSSSVEVASPQKPLQQTANEGSKSVDQMPPHKNRHDGHDADGNRAQSQLRGSRQQKHSN